MDQANAVGPTSIESSFFLFKYDHALNVLSSQNLCIITTTVEQAATKHRHGPMPRDTRQDEEKEAINGKEVTGLGGEQELRHRQVHQHGLIRPHDDPSKVERYIAVFAYANYRCMYVSDSILHNS